MVDENGFSEWKQLILSNLKELKDGQRETAEEITKIRETLAGLKVKHGLMATIAGAASGIVAHFVSRGVK